MKFLKKKSIHVLRSCNYYIIFLLNEYRYLHKGWEEKRNPGKNS